MTSDSDSKALATLKDLNKKRGIVKGRLTSFKKYIILFEGKVLSAEQRNEVKFRIQGINNLFTEYQSIQNDIDELISDSKLQEQLELRESFESEYYALLAKAQCLVDDDVIPPCAGSSPQSVKLPTITLPEFDGSYEHWLLFRDTFLSLVHSSKTISKIQKFHYLKSSLKKDAQLVIDSVEFSADNYMVAWELLLNRYNNSRLLIHNHVKLLFSMPTVSKESSTQIRKLIDTTLRNLRALKVLGEPTEHWGTLINFMIISKLDQTTKREWEQYINISLKSDDSSKLNKVDDLLTFLGEKADMLEKLTEDATHQHKITHDKKQSHPHKVHCNIVTEKTENSTHTKQLNQVRKRLCLLCNKPHPIYSCQKFLNYNLTERKGFIKEKKLCENCLRPGHSSVECRYGPCRKCENKHNSLICDLIIASQIHTRKDTFHSTNESPRPNQASSTASASNDTHTQSYSIQVNSAHCDLRDAHSSSTNPVLLSTALIYVYNSGKLHRARALLDSGSERCFVTKSLCNKLNAQLSQSTQQIRGVNNIVTQCTQTCKLELRSTDGTFISRVQCLVLPKITSTLPNITFENRLFNIPDNITLADPTFFESQPIDILIGVDLFWDLLSEGKIRLPNGPFLQNTKLGWVVTGSIKNLAFPLKHIKCNFTQTATMQSIDSQLRRFWELEELPVHPSSSNTCEEDLCESHFIKTTKRDAHGRFCVTMPLKHSPDNLGDTYAQAERRFYSLERRLNRNPIFKKMYSEFIHEYIALGHMSRVDSYGSVHYFMPHHGVFREHSTTTKLRVVFDASAVSSSGVSLNDLQMVGPPIQGDLISILLRFRERKYVACADIEKFYRQVSLDESQRDLQLILWRDHSSDPLSVYRLNTVTYGTASAPFLSCRCLKQLAQECSNPDVTQTILNQFYVDDLSCSASSKDKLLKVCESTTKVLESACFSLRKWVYNFDNGSQNISDTQTRNLSVGENIHSRTLGLGWYPKQDELYFHTQFEENTTTLSKRIILSIASQIYDPLGLLSPVLTIAKILMQKCWILHLDWDEPVPEDVGIVWNRFVNNLNLLKCTRVPRYVMNNSAGIDVSWPVHNVSIELHIFTDASQSAYGACAYVRTIDNSVGVNVSLLCSKGKVASIKPVMTIPRLELCGALLGARLYLKIAKSLYTQFDKVSFWTDSTIVLGWLHTSPTKLKTYVQNRTSEILDITKGFTWRHVSGKENPADLVSRGCNLDSLNTSSLWWKGPSFLQNLEFEEPVNVNEFREDLPELKSKVVHNFTTQQSGNVACFQFIRFSQFSRMQRAFAYALRFINNTRNRSQKRIGMLSADELNESLLILARLSQQESFIDVYNSFLRNGCVEKTHACLSKLNLFFDENKLIRVGGRIKYAPEFNFDKKHPILISCKHHFAVLLFRYKHKQLMHAAPQLLLYSIRESWWPVGGRNLARITCHSCIVCVRLRGKTLTPIMGNLPQERLDAGFPFIHCGVDYAGPVLILNRRGRGARTIKSYICLFICFTTRAIHLELVSDLSSNSYLLALKRFISRRGKPTEIFSDNGKNFVGLMNEFKNFLLNCSNEIKEYAISQGIKFKMNPPYASHFGGLWEAGIKSCKHHLRRVIGNAHLTFEEFGTVLAEVEAILNSRPLTPLSSDPQDFLPLSPGHFLVGRPLTAPVCSDISNVPSSRLSRYQRVEQIRQHFWIRWSKEYISELQTRVKWQKGVDNLQKNTLVLIKDDNQPPLKWSLGRIIQVFPGKDGVSRVASIKTADSIVRRAFSKICPLPLRDEPEHQH